MNPNPPEWMIAAVNLNPPYVGWWPGDDYMYTRNNSGWNSPQTEKSVDDFLSKWPVDDLIVCTSFQFEITDAYRSRWDAEYPDIDDYEPPFKLTVALWILHPRKGASRGVVVESVSQQDLPRLIDWLKRADDLNRGRFAKLYSDH